MEVEYLGSVKSSMKNEELGMKADSEHGSREGEAGVPATRVLALPLEGAT